VAIAVLILKFNGLDVFQIGDELDITGSIGAFNQQIQTFVYVTKVECIEAEFSVIPRIVSI